MTEKDLFGVEVAILDKKAARNRQKSESKRRRRGANSEKFKKYEREYKAYWRLLNPEKERQNQARFYRMHRGRLKESGKWRSRKSQLKNWYGLTFDSLQAMIDSQGGKCKICESEFEKSGPVIDHCHKINKVRAILCRRCNFMLGHAKDSIETLRKAIAYLEKKR